MADPADTNSSPEKEKEEWELRKLKAEVQQLSKPWLRNPASWIAIAATLAALATALFQMYRSDIDYKLAETKKERTALETERVSIPRQSRGL